MILPDPDVLYRARAMNLAHAIEVFSFDIDLNQKQEGMMISPELLFFMQQDIRAAAKYRSFLVINMDTYSMQIRKGDQGQLIPNEADEPYMQKAIRISECFDADWCLPTILLSPSMPITELFVTKLPWADKCCCDCCGAVQCAFKKKMQEKY